MIKLFTTSQIAAIDRYTIEHEPISDVDLMERAALRLIDHLGDYIRYRTPLLFFAGRGNNGGDALAMARIFAGEDYPVTLFQLDTGNPLSPSCAINRERLLRQGKAHYHTIASEKDFPEIPGQAIVIEGLYGAGLTRPLEGISAALVRHLNQSGAHIFAIDMPAGLLGEDNSNNNPENIIRAKVTLTLQFPKLSLLFPENEPFAGRVRVVDIGLHPRAISQTKTPFLMTGEEDIQGFFPLRNQFAHKGEFGHALLIAGSYGKTGAAVLAAQGCLRAGAGLVTTHTPRSGYTILQTSVPEAMCSLDPHEELFSKVPPLENYTAIGVGPGLGTDPLTKEALLELLRNASVPMVIDADALNIISGTPGGLALLRPGTIITPHPGEFRRLTGENLSGWKRLMVQKELSEKYKIIIVLKGAYTSVTLPEGEIWFNPTGNPGMATGGCGDLLTGIITAFLAQGFSPEKAAVAAVYLHGLTGDISAERFSEPALLASDIIHNLGRAFKKFYGRQQREFD